MTEDELTTESLMKQSKRRLAETIQVQARQVGQLGRELAVANWQAQLLADQRDELLTFLKSEERWGNAYAGDFDGFVGECHQILITDPRDVTRE